MKTKQTGFALVDAILVILIILVAAIGGYSVWQNEKNKNKPAQSSSIQTTNEPVSYTDSAGAFTLKYPQTWKLTYLDSAGGEGTKATPDYTKESRPFTFSPPNRASNQLNIQFGAANAITEDKAKADKFHTIKDLTINGQQAILDKLVFVGPSAAEKYSDDTYIIVSGNFSISLTFRENYYHNSPRENWNDSQDLAGFLSIVNSIKISQSSALTAPSSSASQQNYLTIKEWGIKIGFTDADKVTYKLGNSPGGDTPDGSAKYLASAGLYLLPSITTIPGCQSLGIEINRATPITADAKTRSINGFVYDISGGPGACDGDPGGINGSINQLRGQIDGEEIGSGKYTIVTDN